MTDADLILALRQRGWTDCADAIEAGENLKRSAAAPALAAVKSGGESEPLSMTPEQIAEAGQRLARLEEHRRQLIGVPIGGSIIDAMLEQDIAALQLAQQALREWVPREDRGQAILRAQTAGHDAEYENEAAAHLRKARRLLKLEDTP